MIEKFSLELTNYCNFRCAYCPIDISKREKKSLSYDLTIKILQEIQDFSSLRFVSFSCLGEPLLHPDIFKILTEFSKNRFVTILATNAALFTKDVLVKLVKTNIDYLVVGINAGTKREHDLHNGTIDFKTYIEQISDAVKVFYGHPKIEVVLSYITTMNQDVDIKNRMMYTNRQKRLWIKYWKKYIKSLKKGSKNPNFSQKGHINFESEIYKAAENIIIRFKPLVKKGLCRWILQASHQKITRIQIQLMGKNL